MTNAQFPYVDVGQTTASLSDYYVLVKKLEVEKFEDPYEILKLTSIGGNQPSWLNNKNEWPGEHQQNAKFKVAKWLDAGDVKTGELLFIGFLNEVEREKNKLAQPEASISIVNYDIGPLLARTAQLEATVENHESLFIEVEKQKLAKIEKDEHCRFVGQYKQRVDFMQLTIALAGSTDLDGFKSLVGYSFGSNFDATKKMAKESFDNFAEKEKLWELMVYFCHSKMMYEAYPDVDYGTIFPEYPLKNTVGVESVPPENDSNLSPSSCNSNSLKRKNSGFSGGKRKKATQIVTPLCERATKLRASYAKSFTNFYQGVATPEDVKVLRRNKERERRAKKKLEKLQVNLTQENQTGGTSEDGFD